VDKKGKRETHENTLKNNFVNISCVSRLKRTFQGLDTESDNNRKTSDDNRETSEHVREISEHVRKTSEHVRETSEHVRKTSEHVRETSGTDGKKKICVICVLNYFQMVNFR
jgi:hypothetical protein